MNVNDVPSLVRRSQKASSFLLLLLAFCGGFFSSNVASAAVLYNSKGRDVRIELSGYLKNFFVVQTGNERFLPTQVPASFTGLDALLRAADPSLPQSDLQKDWERFRDEMGTLGQDQLWLRFALKMKLGSKVTFQASYELRPWVGSQPERLLASLPALGPMLSGGQGTGGGAASIGSFTYFDDRFFDFPSLAFERQGVRLQHFLDRFFLSLSLSFADVTIGRQPISMGTGRVFRPNDILAPFSPQEFDTEQRRGVDAIKIEIPLGDVSELMFVGAIQRLYPSCPRKLGATVSFTTSPASCAPGSKTSDYLDAPSPTGLARFKTTIDPVDFFVLTGYIQEDLVGGAGFSTSLLGAGIQGEFLYRYPIVTADKRNPNGVWSATLNVEYNIAKAKLLGGVSYFHQSVGTSDNKEYLKVAQDPRFLRGESFLFGTDYLALYLQWKPHPLVSVQSSFILNLLEPSLLIAPTVEVAPVQDLYITLGAYFGAGSPPKVTTENGAPKIELQSEFGSLGALFLLGIRYYY